MIDWDFGLMTSSEESSGVPPASMDAARALIGECVICFEPFEEDGENEPHLLSCGHTFCLKCIRGLVHEEGGRHIVPCPSCRTVSVLANVPPFLPPKNFQLAELIANIHKLAGSQSLPSQPPASGLPPGSLPPAEAPGASVPRDQQDIPMGLPPTGEPSSFSAPAPQPVQAAAAAAAAPSAPLMEPVYGQYAVQQVMEPAAAPPQAAAAAAAAAAEPEAPTRKVDGGKVPVLESEDELELTKEEQAVFDTYWNAQALMPPDFSLKYQGGYEQALFTSLIQNPAMGYPRTAFRFIDFKINGWEAPDLVRQWIKGRWGAPKGFAEKAVVPPRFSRVLVPHAVFNVNMTAILTGDETYRPQNGGRVSHGKIREQFHINPQHDYVFCSATLLEDRSFYDKAWSSGNKWKLYPVRIFDPDRDLQLIVPPYLWKDTELMTMKKKVFKERQKNSKGFFSSLFSSIAAVFTSDEDEELSDPHLAPPSDAFFLPSVRLTDLWDFVRAKCEAELTSRANSRWSSLSARQDYSCRNKHITITQPSYEAYIIYLPVYSGAYQYSEKGGVPKWYRIAVNGQSGDVEGERPFITVGGVMRNMLGLFGIKKDEEDEDD